MRACEGKKREGVEVKENVNEWDVESKGRTEDDVGDLTLHRYSGCNWILRNWLSVPSEEPAVNSNLDTFL